MSDKIKEKDINYILEKELSPDRYCYIHNYIIDLKREKEDYKSRVEKANEYIEEHITTDSNDDGSMWYTLCSNTSLDDFIINIRDFLQGSKDDK